MPKKDYTALTKDIMEHVGGVENVNGLRHCVTRLRFNLKDEDKADTDYLKKREGVVTVVKANGQYQVVIGNDVTNVYDRIMEITPLGSGTTTETNEQDDRSFLDKFIDLVSGLFQPFLMPLAATGMIKGIVAILGIMGMTADNSGLYFLLQAAGDGFFQFLPIMVAVNAAQKFKMNLFTGLAIAVAFLHPSVAAVADTPVLYTLFSGTPLESAIHLTAFGLPVILPQRGYYSTIIPIIIAIWLGSVIEKWAKNRIPQVVSSFLTPFITVLITVPLAFTVIGPVANWLSSLIAAGFMGLYGFSPMIFGALLTASWQILVIFGVHWGLVPLGYLLLANNGSESILAMTVISTFPAIGVMAAMLIKSKEKKVRDIALPGMISAIFGVTEPIIYGLLLPMRKPFIYVIIANFIAGGYAGLMHVVDYRTGGLGIFSVLNYIHPENGLGSEFWNILITFAMATVLGFVIQMIFPVPSLDPKSDTTSSAEDEMTPTTTETNSATVSESEMAASAREEIIASPVSGEVHPMSDTPDEVFASQALGKGVMIMPTEGVVSAPANGKVTALFPTGHAIGMTTDMGTELLIHIGINTVQLEGKGFEILVHQGDSVTAGQELIRFDIDTIKQANLSTAIPIVITNTVDYTDVLPTTESQVSRGDYLLTTLK
ncbi:MAG: beta-glucoside-specific PTS transporter subunit IIABC [Aerococcus sp.]|nr:beta-glucoside-specific PTS transporter subunit IIABC [Aerococcus sp.]